MHVVNLEVLECDTVLSEELLESWQSDLEYMRTLYSSNWDLITSIKGSVMLVFISSLWSKVEHWHPILEIMLLKNS